MGKKSDILFAEWLCFKCGHINPTKKEWRKRIEYTKVCLNCGTKKPMRAI